MKVDFFQTVLSAQLERVKSDNESVKEQLDNMDATALEIPDELLDIPVDDSGWGTKCLKELKALQKKIIKRQEEVDRFEKAREDASDLDLSGVDLSGSDGKTLKKIAVLSKKVKAKIIDKTQKLRQLAQKIKDLKKKESNNKALKENKQLQLKAQEKGVVEFAEKHSVDRKLYQQKLGQAMADKKTYQNFIAKLNEAKAQAMQAARGGSRASKPAMRSMPSVRASRSSRSRASGLSKRASRSKRGH